MLVKDYKMIISNLQSRVDRVDGFYKALLKQKSDIEEEKKGLLEECEILSKTSIVLKHLLDTMVKDDVSRMAGLLTYGLKTVFDDQNLSFSPVMTKKNEKIWIELKTENDGVEGEFESFGGSVAVIESFLLRVICMLKLKLAKLMLLDETFAPVGDDYIPNTSRLVSELSKKLGLDILLVTHQKEFQTFADCVYRVYKSKEGLKMEKIK